MRTNTAVVVKLTSARSFRRVLRVLARMTSGLGLSLASRNSTHSAGENICEQAGQANQTQFLRVIGDQSERTCEHPETCAEPGERDASADDTIQRGGGGWCILYLR